MKFFTIIFFYFCSFHLVAQHIDIEGTNIFIGTETGFDITSGNSNVLLGWKAGANITSGNANTFVGTSTGIGTTQGFNNVFIGNQVGGANLLGDNNTLLGSNADVSNISLVNATALGYDAVVNASNKVRIGNSSVSVIEGQVAFSASSDRRLKTNINDLKFGLELINSLRPVMYIRNGMENTGLEMGLIAQEVQAVIEKSVDEKMGLISQSSDGYLTLRYNDIIAPLIKAVQELSQNNIELTDRVKQLEKKLGESVSRYPK